MDIEWKKKAIGNDANYCKLQFQFRTIPVLILLIYCMECLFVLQFAGQDEMLWEVQRKVTLLKRKVSIKLLTL